MGARALTRERTVQIKLDRQGEPKEIGEYTILNLLGRGGMGVVYEASDTQKDRRVALKTIETGFLKLSDSHAERRFNQEIDALSRLHHPGVVRLFEAGIASHPLNYRMAFFVMEKLEGKTLKSLLLDERGLPSYEALRIALALAETLVYLHKHDVAHRDIKPSNIVLENDGRVVLMDFGLATSIDSTRLTRTGHILGSRTYLSPDRLCGSHESAVDVWALGVVFYQMFVGGFPFGNSGRLTILETPDILWPQNFQNGWRAEVRSLIEYMLVLDPSLRITPGALLRRLRSLKRRSASLSRPEALPSRPISPVSRGGALHGLAKADEIPNTLSEIQRHRARLRETARKSMAFFSDPALTSLPRKTWMQLGALFCVLWFCSFGVGICVGYMLKREPIVIPSHAAPTVVPKRAVGTRPRRPVSDHPEALSERTAKLYLP